MDKPWTQLGGLQLDPVTAREVKKHRKKSLEHPRSLEKIEVELQKAQMGRTSKAMPALPKAEDKPAEKMGVCGSTAKFGPHWKPQWNGKPLLENLMLNSKRGMLLGDFYMATTSDEFGMQEHDDLVHCVQQQGVCSHQPTSPCSRANVRA